MTRPPSDHQLEDRTYLSARNLVTEPRHPDEMYEFFLSEINHIDWDCEPEEAYARECQSHMRAIARWQNSRIFKQNRIEAEAWCPVCGTEDVGRYDPMLPTAYCVDCIDDRWLERTSNYFRSEEVSWHQRKPYKVVQKASCPTGLTVSLSWDHPPGPCAHFPSQREMQVAIHNLLNQARTDCDRMEVTPDR
jgi:hypothetical protein